MDEETLRLARIIWDYHRLGQAPAPADAILALGTNDLRVAEHAADLYLAGFAPLLVCSGGIAHDGDLLETAWARSEAEMYARTAIGRGVPEECIVLETLATNTAENIRFSRLALECRGVSPRSILIAVKPFMQRRAWATLQVEWPEVQATVSSPEMALDDYFTPELTPERIVNILVGDLQRVWLYARRGWSARQEVPPEVMEAYRALVRMGFDRHLAPED